MILPVVTAVAIASVVAMASVVIGVAIAGVVITRVAISTASGDEACGSIVENVAGGVIGECLCAIHVDACIDNFDPVLGIVCEGAAVHVDGVGAGRFNIHAIEPVASGCYIVE